MLESQRTQHNSNLFNLMLQKEQLEGQLEQVNERIATTKGVLAGLEIAEKAHQDAAKADEGAGDSE